MTLRSVIYRALQAASWLLAMAIALGLYSVVSDYVREGLVAKAGIYPPHAGWKVFVTTLLWGVPPLGWLWLIHRRPVRGWFLSAPVEETPKTPGVDKPLD